MPCGTDGWPADIVDDIVKPNGVGIMDLTDYITPNRYFNTNIADWPDQAAARRHDLSPGSNGLLKEINIVDLTAMALTQPPMLNGASNFNSTCPSPS